MDAREEGRAHATADVHDHDHNAVGHVRGGRRGRGHSQLGRHAGPTAARPARLQGQVEPTEDRAARRLLGAVQLRAGPPVVPMRRVHHVHHPRGFHVPRQSGNTVEQVSGIILFCRCCF